MKKSGTPAGATGKVNENEGAVAVEPGALGPAALGLPAPCEVPVPVAAGGEAGVVGCGVGACEARLCAGFCRGQTRRSGWRCAFVGGLRSFGCRAHPSRRLGGAAGVCGTVTVVVTVVVSAGAVAVLGDVVPVTVVVLVGLVDVGLDSVADPPIVVVGVVAAATGSAAGASIAAIMRAIAHPNRRVGSGGTRGRVR